MVGTCGFCWWQVENVFWTRRPKPANEATCARAWGNVDVVVLVVVVDGWQRQVGNVFFFGKKAPSRPTRQPVQELGP